MSKQAISVTLEADNVLWLKGRARAAGARSVSELLDQIVTKARGAGAGGPPRSVVGTIDIDPTDPDLRKADAAVRALFAASVNRPFYPTAKSAARRTSRRPGGRRRRA